MQVRNSASLIRSVLPPVRETQPQTERLPARQQQDIQPPVERVVQGELLSETRLNTTRVASEQPRILEAQANLDSRTRTVLQTYLDIEAASQSRRPGFDIIV